MSNKLVLPFSCRFRSDGSSDTVDIDVGHGPVAFSPLYGIEGYVLANDLALNITDVQDLMITVDGVEANLVSIVSGVVTLSLTGSIDSGTDAYVFGSLIF